MYPHHQHAIDALTLELERDSDILCLLLSGSLAHGTASEISDVDMTIVVDEAAFEGKKASGKLMLWRDLSAYYEGGYLDAKFITAAFLKEVADKGSEPARYAFSGAQVLFDRTDEVPALLAEITRYPVEEKAEKLGRFYAQLEAWHWYAHEAIKHNNAYLLNHSVSNLILFGGRIVLALNETLYPYHKWFMRVLSEVPDKPAQLMKTIDALLGNKGAKEIDAFYDCIKAPPLDVPTEKWSHQFMLDSELNWLDGKTPVADL